MGSVVHDQQFSTYLDLGLNVLDGVGRLHLEGDGLAGEGLHEDLHPAAKPQDEVEGALLLDVVIRESSSVFELLPGENEPLLVRGDALLVLKQTRVYEDKHNRRRRPPMREKSQATEIQISRT